MKKLCIKTRNSDIKTKNPDTALQSYRLKKKQILHSPSFSSASNTIQSKSKPYFSSFLSPNSGKSLTIIKHNHRSSHNSPLLALSPESAFLSHKGSPTFLEHNVFFPVSPKELLETHKLSFSNFEYSEIMEYSTIYYIGKEPKKPIKHKEFTDNSGNYIHCIGDHIAYRYEILDLLGSGSFGKVLKVVDHKNNEELALKIIKNKPGFEENARDEIKILEYLQQKDQSNSNCIVHIKEYFTFRNHIVTST